MSEQLKRDVIYIDLDCLLDTRLGTLAALDLDYAFNALGSKEYFTRHSDEFKGVNTQAFNELYAKRDMEILRASMLTNIIVLLQSFMKSSVEEIFKGGQAAGLEICINTYPYLMDEQERYALVEIMQHKLAPEIEISSVYLTDQDLTPTFCKTSYAVMVRYHFHKWMELHVEEWKTVQMPGVAFYAPAIYTKTPTDQELKEMAKDKLHPFQATELLCAPLFQLRLLDIEMFCIHDSIRSGKGAFNKAA